MTLNEYIEKLVRLQQQGFGNRQVVDVEGYDVSDPEAINGKIYL
jgi:hypothetical protein